MNKKNLLPILTGILGAGAGCGITWYFTKKYYEIKEEEEVASIREKYECELIKIRNDYSPPLDISEEETEVKDIKELDKMVRESRPRVDYNAISRGKDVEIDSGDGVHVELDTPEPFAEPLESEGPVKPGERPYVIDPAEYGEYDGYNMISLTHYADGVLADNDDNIVDDVDEIVGLDYVDHIGEYEDDAVHIRNDAKRCDYEILASLKTWDDVLKSKPYLNTED